MRLGADNVVDILAGYDVVVDGTDNFPTRYLLNDASLKLGIPVVHGSIFRFEGQVTVFEPHDGPCYRCLLPEPPPAELAPRCAEAGVLGVLPGIVGSIQALEAIKLILGLGDPLVGRSSPSTPWRGASASSRSARTRPTRSPGRTGTRSWWWSSTGTASPPRCRRLPTPDGSGSSPRSVMQRGPESTRSA